MKKFFALLLALTLLLSLGVTAFAAPEEQVIPGYETGTQTLRTTVPDPAKSWTIYIPADVEIAYKAKKTNIGQGSINVDMAATGLDAWTVGEQIVIHCLSTYELTSDNNTIHYSILCDEYGKEYYLTGDIDVVTRLTYIQTGVWEQSHPDIYVIIDDDAWSKAEPGNYTSVLTYSSNLLPPA